MTSPRGLFISFEGSEGCGKSTQIRQLASRLERMNRRILLTREPGGTALGEQIRHLLQFAKEGREMTSETELLLFAASRAQLVRQIIAPALADGITVIADRFHDSTTVYQGVARRLSAQVVAAINEFAAGEIRPDITLVLDLDSGEAKRRLLRRPRPADGVDRMEQQPPEFYEAVRAGYLELAKREPERVRVIDASASIDEVGNLIWRAIEPLLLR